MPDYENLNILWASVIIEELIRNGADYFCISPGSRSSPLVVAVARNKKAKSIVHYDERGIAYHAVGYARATEKPAVVITTSGTAVSNCFPAVIEASMDNIPLIVISADRPPELQDSMANQTIEQTHIFGRYIRYFFTLPCPSEDIPIEMLLTTIDQAVFRSLATPKGPVHINCMFREPLSPEKKKFSFKYTQSISNWFSSSQPYTTYYVSKPSLSSEELKHISYIINTAKNGFIIIGKLNWTEKKEVLRFIKKFKWPVFSDIRANIFLTDNIIPYSSLLLSNCMINADLDLVLHIGGTIISKHIMQFIKKISPKEYIVIKDHPYRQDPEHVSTIQLQTDINRFCRDIIPLLNPKPSKILDELKLISTKIENILKDSFQVNDINEVSLFYLLASILPDNTGLFLSNSLPVRDMDMYGQIRNNIIVGANRGASGIDGIIASATGFAAGLNKPVTLVIGDLAFIHDLNSLFIIKKIPVPLIIILINNNGGGIFSFLNISRYKDIFEKYFAVPHNITSFKGIGLLSGLPYFMVKNQKEFLEIYNNLIDKHESGIIEIYINRDGSYSYKKFINKRIENLVSESNWLFFKK